MYTWRLQLPLELHNPMLIADATLLPAPSNWRSQDMKQELHFNTSMKYSYQAHRAKAMDYPEAGQRKHVSGLQQQWDDALDSNAAMTKAI